MSAEYQQERLGDEIDLPGEQTRKLTEEEGKEVLDLLGITPDRGDLTAEDLEIAKNNLISGFRIVASTSAEE
jgi:hypothetical protein